MQGFLAGQDITLTFDLSTAGVEVVSVEYAVLNQDGLVVVPRTPIAGVDASTTEVAVVIPAISNTLAADKSISARSVVLYITGTGLAAGIVSMRAAYALLAEDRLPTPSASFQSLVSADMVAFDLPNVAAWDAASDRQKVSALLESRNRLARLRYRWVPGDSQSRVGGSICLNEEEFNDMTAPQWDAMDPQFKEAMKRAQVLEAVSLLTVDPDAEFREAGVTSITIGESSRTYLRTRSGAAKLPLSSRAMNVLARFLMAPGLVRT